MWKRRQYRPAWLWSVIEVLKESKQIAKDIQIKCDVAGGGNSRGAHNCRNCDHQILKAIKSFSLSQNVKEFDNLDCECKEKWYDQLDIENLSFGSLVDFPGG